MSLCFYTKSNCPLCDRLERMVAPLLAARGLAYDKQALETDPAAERRYGMRIPVLLCDGRVLLEGRPTKDEVRRAVARLAPVGNDA